LQKTYQARQHSKTFVGFKNVKKYSIPREFDTVSPGKFPNGGNGNMRHFKVHNNMKKDISKDISSAIMQQEMSMSKSKMMGYKNSDEV
jgi:hypothetical protein